MDKVTFSINNGPEHVVQQSPGHYNITNRDLFIALAHSLAYEKSQEKQIDFLKRRCAALEEVTDPGRRRKDIEAALDGEIRLLREQG